MLTRDDAARIIRIARQERDRYRVMACALRSPTATSKADALHNVAYDIARYVRHALHKAPLII